MKTYSASGYTLISYQGSTTPIESASAVASHTKPILATRQAWKAGKPGEVWGGGAIIQKSGPGNDGALSFFLWFP